MAVNRPFFLAIEGPIGVGKTTLARLLQPRLESHIVLEAFEENPFLSDFYGDRARYAFQTQMFFLLSRYRQHQAILSVAEQEPVVSDYTFGKDYLFARLNLSGDELDVYRRLYEVLAQRVPLPDLVIYLRADVDTLMSRVAARDRAYERKMDREYMARVAAAYQESFSHYPGTALLTIDTEDLNYVRDAAALTFVETEVRKSLGIGAYQQSLPQLERPTARLAHMPPPPTTERVGARGALDEFASANEAMARIGSLLAARVGGLPDDQISGLRTALYETMKRLAVIADEAGIDLRRDQL